MASAAQVLANQANAKLSTGPVTDAGKSIAAQNSRKHGFTARTLIVPDEDRAAFETMRAQLVKDVRPEGALEDALFERLLLASWNLQRITRHESRLLDETDPFAPDSPAAAGFDRLVRYRRDLERSFSSALAELRKLQTQRAALLQKEDVIIRAVYETTPLAEISRLTRDTDRFLDSGRHVMESATFSMDRKSAIRRHNEQLRAERNAADSLAAKAAAVQNGADSSAAKAAAA
ncbi:MAG: hypothetical protein HY858_07885 [Candidatus Solibacter usitatus]|nr:hypothetical protein [Candidatus Solibacter usitatus]